MRRSRPSRRKIERPAKMLRQLGIACVLAAVLAGCGTSRVASVSGGECKVFQNPGFVVKGRSSIDQDWIDETIESGISACGWKRPRAK